MTHQEETPAEDELIRIGMPALKYGVLELFLSEDPVTRMRAWIVVYWVTQIKMGHVGAQWDPGEEREWRQLWQSNGPSNWSASDTAFRASYEKWRVWLKENDI